MMAVGVTTALADDEIVVNRKVKESFQKEFTGVNAVRWSDLGDYQVAIFAFDGHMVEAYFNSETGELEGCARYLIFDELPLAVMKTFSKNFSRADFISALEISNAEGNFYRLILETQNKRYSIKISAGGNILRKVKITQ
ncbi:hypothetical protein GCM10027043_05040 [Ferruginibacter profundus]